MVNKTGDEQCSAQVGSDLERRVVRHIYEAKLLPTRLNAVISFTVIHTCEAFFFTLELYSRTSIMSAKDPSKATEESRKAQ